MSQKRNKITEVSQRPYDNMYNLWLLLPDPECDIIVDEDNATYIPRKWVIGGVFDDKKKAKDKEKEFIKKIIDQLNNQPMFSSK